MHLAWKSWQGQTLYLNRPIRRLQRKRSVLNTTLNVFECKANWVFRRESLLKGKAAYSLPPCTNLIRSVAFDNGNIIYFFYKTSSPNEEVNRTEPSPRVSVPWFLLLFTLCKAFPFHSKRKRFFGEKMRKNCSRWNPIFCQTSKSKKYSNIKKENPAAKSLFMSDFSLHRWVIRSNKPMCRAREF